MEYTALDLQSFQQEYECTFIDSAESYISLELIYKNTPGMREGDRQNELDEGQGEIVDDRGNDNLEIKVFKTVDDLILWYDPVKHGDFLYLGYDVARTRDAAVIFIIGLLPNRKKVSVAQIEMFSQTYEYQRDQIRAIMRSGLPIDRGCIDSTGIGSDTTETLQREFTPTKLEAVEFNVESKDKMARGVKEGLENSDFLLQNDNKFHRQIHSIKRIAISGGAWRYDSERDELGHADSFWAWALANYAIPKFNARKGFYDEVREKRMAATTGKQGGPVTVTGSEIQRGKSANAVLRKMGVK
jgi:phage FluMu gp28-like protein